MNPSAREMPEAAAKVYQRGITIESQLMADILAHEASVSKGNHD